jgi:hypothetical protein
MENIDDNDTGGGKRPFREKDTSKFKDSTGKGKKAKKTANDASSQEKEKEKEVTTPEKHSKIFFRGPSSYYLFRILHHLYDEDTVDDTLKSFEFNSCSAVKDLYWTFTSDMKAYYKLDYDQACVTEADLILMMSHNKFIWTAVLYIIGHGDKKWIPSAHFISESLRISLFHYHYDDMHLYLSTEDLKPICLYIYSIFGEGYYSNVIPFDIGQIYKEDEDVLGRFIAFVRKNDLFEIFYDCLESKMQTWVVLMKIISNIYKNDILRAWFYKQNRNWVFEKANEVALNDEARQQSLSLALKVQLSITQNGDKTLDTDDWRIFKSYAETDDCLSNNFAEIKSEDDILNDLNRLYKLRYPYDGMTRRPFVQYWAEIRFGHFLQIPRIVN